MNMINAKTRFAWDPVTSRIYDYKTNKHHAPEGELHDRDGGVWDLAHLAHLLRNDQFIDTAHFNDSDPSQPTEATKPYVGRAKDLTVHVLPQPSDAADDADQAGSPAVDTGVTQVKEPQTKPVNIQPVKPVGTDDADAQTQGAQATGALMNGGTDDGQPGPTEGDPNVQTDNGAPQGTA